MSLVNKIDFSIFKRVTLVDGICYRIKTSEFVKSLKKDLIVLLCFESDGYLYK